MRTTLAVALALTAAACGGAGESGDDDGAAPARETAAAPAELTVDQEIGLGLSEPEVLQAKAGRNPTTAVDPESGTVYAAWARELPAVGDEDPLLEAVLARSDDGGATFSDPVVVSPSGVRVASYTVSPTQVEVGPGGEVHVLFLENVPEELPGYEYGLSSLQLVTSTDGGKTFSAPVDVAPEGSEGVVTSMEMATLFVAPGGDLYVSFLDFREEITIALDKKAGKIPLEDPEEHGHGDEKPGPEVQMRLVRSTDGGRTFAPSTLVFKPTCACCGTKVAEGSDTPLFVTTRSDWKELKGSKDSVRDPFLSTSKDHGKTFAKPVKISDDGFKISGCPDVNAGLAVDGDGRLHAAWYTGAESGPGVYHAVSDDDGETFTTPTALLRDAWVPYGDVQMALDGDNRVWIAYEDRRADVDKIQVVRIDGDERVYTKAWPGTAPDLATSGDEVVVVWGEKAGEHDESGPVRVAVVSQGTGEAALGR